MKTTKNKEVYEKDICGFDGKASMIIIPETEEEIANAVKMNKCDIVPRGSGINFNGGCVPNNSIVVDMGKMKKILQVNSSRKLVDVEAGVNVDELNNVLSNYGLEFPVSPLLSGLRTIGGIIATNAAGIRELKYGRTANWVDSMEAVDGRGERIHVSKADSSDFVGMEGVTGIITRAKLRLTTKKQRTLSILKSVSLDEVLDVGKRVRLEQDVSMIELVGRKLAVMLGLEDKNHLFIELENDKGQMGGETYTKFMRLKDKSYYFMASHGFTLMENPKFFSDSLRDFLGHLEQVDIPYLCNLGSGVVYCCFNPADKLQHEEVIETIRRFRAKVSYSFGIGLTKKSFVDKSEKEIIRRVKTRYDPEWKFNQNKLIDYSEKDIKKGFIGRAEGRKEESVEEKIEKKIEEKKEETLKSLVVEQKVPEQKTPEQKIQEFIDGEKIDEMFLSKPIDEESIKIVDRKKVEEKGEKEEKPTQSRAELFRAIENNIVLKKDDRKELSEEEKEKIRKIAGGFFGRT